MNVHDEPVAVPPHETAAEPISLPVHSYTFGPFRIDVSARHLLRDEAIVPLTAKVFDTLLMLAKNHRVAVSKDELMHAVWPNSFVSDDSLVQNISAIRRALGDDSSQPQYIATLARRGYRFIGDVKEHATYPVPVPAVTKGAEPVEPLSGPQVPSAAVPRAAFLWVTAALVTGLVAGAVALNLWRPASRSQAAGTSIRFREALPAGEALQGGGKLSPNGLNIAYTARDDSGVTRLWIRALEANAARLVPGTEGALSPFWSPDSQFIGFFANSQIKRVSVAGGAPRVIATTQRGDPPGGAWMLNDLILFADQGKILSVNSSGGTPAVVIEPDKKAPEGELRWPYALPDGRHFLFFVSSDDRDKSGTYVGTLGSRDTTELINAKMLAMYAPPGYLLYVRDGVVIAQKFDVAQAKLSGEPMTVVSDVANNTTL